MKNLDDLRSILFAEIENIKNNPSQENLDRAGSINLLAQSLISTAKVEVDFLVKTDSDSNSEFINPSLITNKQPNIQALPNSREKTGRKW